MRTPETKPQSETGASWLAELFSMRHWRMASLVAASLLMMVGVRVYLRHDAQPVSDIGGSMVWRSGRMTVVSPARDVLAAPAEFEWQPVEGAAKYRIQVMEVDRTIIWTAETSATRISTTSNLKQRMTPGRTFTWEVIALNAAGEKIASADPQTLRIPATAK